MGKKALKKLITFLCILGAIQEAYHIFRVILKKRHREYIGREVPTNIAVGQRGDDVGIQLLIPNTSSYKVETFKVRQGFNVDQVNCSKIFNSDRDEINKAINLKREMLPDLDNDLSMYMELRHNCSHFKERRGYILDKVPEEERKFSIAFSILLFKDFNQVERLLRTIYRQHNYYCLQVDSTANPLLQALVRVYADCFTNVISSNEVDIVWGSFSLAEAEFSCMYALQKFHKWRYFINLTGQEYPLKTNLQIVKILKALNGSNHVWTASHEPYQDVKEFETRLKTLGPVPHGIKIVKGSAHVVFSRQFVKFLTSDQRVVNLASFLNPSFAPEESLWTSINNDPTLKAPGGSNYTTMKGFITPWLSREKWWPHMNARCGSFYVNGICIFGVSNIHTLTRSLALFANKFYWDNQPLALGCLQEWMYNRTREEYLGKYTFDVSSYTALLAHSQSAYEPDLIKKQWVN